MKRIVRKIVAILFLPFFLVLIAMDYVLDDKTTYTVTKDIFAGWLNWMKA